VNYSPRLQHLQPYIAREKKITIAITQGDVHPKQLYFLLSGKVQTASTRLRAPVEKSDKYPQLLKRGGRSRACLDMNHMTMTTSCDEMNTPWVSALGVPRLKIFLWTLFHLKVSFYYIRVVQNYLSNTWIDYMKLRNNCPGILKSLARFLTTNQIVVSGPFRPGVDNEPHAALCPVSCGCFVITRSLTKQHA